MEKLQNERLHHKVEQALLEVMKNTGYASTRLKAEEELAAALGVSRSTVREAMNSLHRKGILTKRHGKGNFVHKSAVETKMRIDIYQDFPALLRDGGYEPQLKQSDFRMQNPTAKAAEVLLLKPEELVCSFTWLYFADQDPAIYVGIQVPATNLHADLREKEVEPTLRSFLEKYCGQDVAHSIAKMKAVDNELIAGVFGLAKQQPMLMWEEIFYNIYDEPLCYNEIFFNPGVLELSILRKV